MKELEHARLMAYNSRGLFTVEVPSGDTPGQAGCMHMGKGRSG